MAPEYIDAPPARTNTSTAAINISVSITSNICINTASSLSINTSINIAVQPLTPR